MLSNFTTPLDSGPVLLPASNTKQALVESNLTVNLLNLVAFKVIKRSARTLENMGLGGNFDTAYISAVC